MHTKELYQNVRKAYRLAYEVQHSIVEMIDYIRTRIKTIDYAGKQVFSDPLAKHRGVDEGYVTDYIGTDIWSWDYFPTFMYMYYFKCKPTETQNSCFAIIQIMDDGFTKIEQGGFPLITENFKDPADSESYVLLSFAIWNNKRRAIWFEHNGKDEIKDEKAEIMRISQAIKGNGGEPYVKKVPDAAFVVGRTNLESMCSTAEVDDVLHAFADLVKLETGYQILLDETEEENTNP